MSLCVYHVHLLCYQLSHVTLAEEYDVCGVATRNLWPVTNESRMKNEMGQCCEFGVRKSERCRARFYGAEFCVQDDD